MTRSVPFAKSIRWGHSAGSLGVSEDRLSRPGTHFADAPHQQHDTRRNGQSLTRLEFAALIFAVWTGVGVFVSVPDMLNGFNFYALLAKLIEAWAWGLLTPVLLAVDRRIDSKPRNIVRLSLIFLLLSVPFTLSHTLLTSVLLYPIPQIMWSPLRNHPFAIYFFISGWVTYCAIIGMLLAFKFYSRFQRAERSLLEWRLNALRLHLEPHFLFNALNAISSEIDDRPHLAQDMIADLGALLRLSLDSKNSPEITLAQELTLLEHYLSIQKVRFGKRIHISVNFEAAALSARVPSLLLQPLVENAIRHGVEGKRSGGKIAVSAVRSGNWLQLTVADNGRGLPAGWELESSTGHGLRVTLERLSTMYPECSATCLKLNPRREGGTEAVVRLPFVETSR